MTRFVSGATTLQFNQDPLRGDDKAAAIVQVRGLDSNGADYAYRRRKHRLIDWRLTFPGLTNTVIANLRSFVSGTIDGSRLTFTWYDHADTARTVRLGPDELVVEPAGPGRSRVTISLFEVAL